MKNIEKYQNELENFENRSLVCFIAKEKVGLRCDVGDCLKCEKEAFKWLLKEYEEPILAEEDKRILKDIINVYNSFNKKIVDIRKYHVCRGCYLHIDYINRGENTNYIKTHTTLPFNNNKLFKGMELGKSYTLEELGLWQK